MLAPVDRSGVGRQLSVRGVLAGGAPLPAMDRTRGFGYTDRAVDL